MNYLGILEMRLPAVADGFFKILRGF